MKKLIYILVLFLFIPNVNALDKQEITFSSCVDGDTFKAVLNNKKITIRLLAVDTEESVSKKKENTYMGKVASNYTCTRLMSSKKIELEYDSNSDKKDKYNRTLGWVYLDDKLLQEDLIKKGYAKVAYLYGDYKYTTKLEVLEASAKLKKLGIWKDNNYIEIVYNLIQKIVKIFT